jgi:biopolymer transport protein ExbB/TolQ
MNIVIGGVAEALVCTAAGLFVAIPAVIAFNYFTRKVEHFMDDMELCASELIDLMGGK